MKRYVGIVGVWVLLGGCSTLGIEPHKWFGLEVNCWYGVYSDDISCGSDTTPDDYLWHAGKLPTDDEFCVMSYIICSI